jgi:transposase
MAERAAGLLADKKTQLLSQAQIGWVLRKSRDRLSLPTMMGAVDGMPRMIAAMKTMPNKTDRNDARALAQIMRTGWFRPVPVKTRQCRPWRSLLVARRTVLNEMRAIENVVRAILREGGIKLGTLSRAAFAGRVRELASGDPVVMRLVEPLLAILATMLDQLARLTKQVPDIVREEKVCRRLMSVPGVGVLGLDPRITALAFRATIDRPDRFRRSRDVGAHLGLTKRATSPARPT